MLDRALRSVVHQTWPPDQISVAIDHHGDGASVTRNRALDAIDTEWVAFLDDDDEFLPLHLERLVVCAQETSADLAYSWFEGINTSFFRIPSEEDPKVLISPEGVPWSPHVENCLRVTCGNFIPITVMARTSLVKEVGGFSDQGKPGEYPTGEDYVLWTRLLEAGAKFVHLPERTWRWNGHMAHTSGRSWKMPVHGSAEFVRTEQAAGREVKFRKWAWDD
jgi:glycosyltransferase involved in cell wall biosynthesis